MKNATDGECGVLPQFDAYWQQRAQRAERRLKAYQATIKARGKRREVVCTPTVADAIAWANQEAGDNFDPQDVLGHYSRKADLVHVRRLAMWRLRSHYNWSFPRIAKAFDGRDHATVMHHCRKVEERLARASQEQAA